MQRMRDDATEASRRALEESTGMPVVFDDDLPVGMAAALGESTVQFGVDVAGPGVLTVVIGGEVHVLRKADAGPDPRDRARRRELLWPSSHFAANDGRHYSHLKAHPAIATRGS